MSRRPGPLCAAMPTAKRGGELDRQQSAGGIPDGPGWAAARLQGRTRLASCCGGCDRPLSKWLERAQAQGDRPPELNRNASSGG
eukprot:CAMPEP_0170384256 /NCGR_PEP_ID=MMETSP0117_2-20130122/15903_1 /TAXON_ID=400756 /ORGANISM="Durinskia baltica, Strain CSIRO CS-38" /LENGTH=83 /DNA_ID=CAMNT_0010639997 /DNA_START=157 /DNA_END=408 /DNA_ORIENTATION=-